MVSNSFLSVDGMVSELDISRSALYRWFATGRGLKVIRLPNGAIGIRRSDLEEWLCTLESPRKA
ncbi:hypothetical protein GCM10010439_30450 [Actinocorallia aurantiaca]|uniref:AlpA family transcriptional regulator n=1 Tax=Actinocorallia aurantiaca TaxID=46204 RepID=A0ABN3U9W9_9ACTN